MWGKVSAEEVAREVESMERSIDVAMNCAQETIDILREWRESNRYLLDYPRDEEVFAAAVEVYNRMRAACLSIENAASQAANVIR